MILNGLQNLYLSMKLQMIQRYKFKFSYCDVDFDVFFFIDETPFKLAFGALVHNFYFEVKVYNGFRIDTCLSNDTYNELVAILNLSYSENGPYRPIYFFEAFNKTTPVSAKKKNIAKPHDIARYITDIEESEKIYFCGWRDDDRHHDHVRLSNLEKTRKLLSKDAYIMCKEKNISSQWTADKNKMVEFYMPSV